MGGAVLLLDLDGVPPRERVEAFHHAMTDTSVPNRIRHEEPDTGMRARFEGWRIGGLDLFDMRSTGFEVRRTAWHVRRHRDRPVVSVSLQTRGTHRAETGGRQRVLGPSDICVFHELAPRAYGWSGQGASRAVTLDMADLGLPVEAVVHASLRLRASPLHGLVLSHLRCLFHEPERLQADPGAAAVSRTTVELVRALLTSAAWNADDARVRGTMDDSLPTRVMAYARRHLADPDLTPERIAHAHHVSVRHLYAVLARAGIGLEQWLITERLERARHMLGDPRWAHLSVGALAARCGFTSHSHFTRRFRAAYGTTPSALRRHRPDTRAEGPGG
ncbi:AraC family transcriptional regulator [Streptomyces sp. NPDC049881]|uniref:AraC family transcriptional regulator n=1 Tax=Streptomyces sp. NPDC049881 TaxID=3155778 RepID=UPI00342B0255